MTEVLISGSETSIDQNPVQNFSSPPPVYMWYDTSDDSASHAAAFVCDVSVSDDETSFEKGIFKNSKKFVHSDIPDNFGPEVSGVYQCAMWNKPDKSVWYQRTTYVVVAGTCFLLQQNLPSLAKNQA